ncbi:MAG: Methyltransferase type 11 [Frankiales bacterium]|nr:Methyltransferase type 11 [Frankiales bacterium]
MADELPDWFFTRADDRPDPEFYRTPRLVTHIDAGAIEAVGRLYAELGLDGTASSPRRVLDLMSSWVSHLTSRPGELVALGLNRVELEANPLASQIVVQDLNQDPILPFADQSFDGVLCCVSIDYLSRPIEVLREAARVLRPAAPIVITFSNRCFPSKAIRGWLSTDDAGRCAIVVDYLERAGGFSPPEVSRRTAQNGRHHDPLYAVVAYKSGELSERAT